MVNFLSDLSKLNTMNKMNSSSTPIRNQKNLDNKESSVTELKSQSYYTVCVRYDKNSPEAQNDRKATELFSSFTANIIKEETLFIR